MTGFGRGEAGNPEHLWVAEVRTVNHRFLDQKIALPRGYAGFEDLVRKQVAAHLVRGHVDIQLTVSGEKTAGSRLQLNRELAQQYHDCLLDLRRAFALEGGIRLADMLTLRDLISLEEVPPNMDEEWALASAALNQALISCEAMRQQEGLDLKAELSTLLRTLESTVDRIAAQKAEILQQRQRELGERVRKLLSGVDLDPMRLAQECAILADKSDVTEEIARLKSHIAQFSRFLDMDEAVGRRLDFLLQEFLREVNTLCSKISNADIAQLGVEMKNDIEKLREQVQNLE